MRTIVLATRNPGKCREIATVLEGTEIALRNLADWPGLPEPDETAETFDGNARDKARYYSTRTGLWCLADDSGLAVDALDGAPGVYSARFADDQTPPHADRATVDAANNAKLLRLLEDVPEEQRTARFVCCLALADGEKILLETRGTVEGVIARDPRGNNGFGYDPLFLLPDRNCTTAQLAPEEKNAISHRGRAVREFAANVREGILRK
jgi:non-canonical purine NTP pyrophosphatase (RdgB/HAM1 family)